MVYKTEDVMYGYKAVYVCKKDKPGNSYQLLKIPECINVICAVIKIEIPKGTTIVDPWGQKNNDDSGFHKLRCEGAKFIEVMKYCYIHITEKIDESELKFTNTINLQLIEISEKEVIDYNKSKDIEYCSMYTYGNSLLIDANTIKPNDFMVADPYLNTNDDIVCASGIHFFKTEKEVYNYLLRLHS